MKKLLTILALVLLAANVVVADTIRTNRNVVFNKYTNKYMEMRTHLGVTICGGEFGQLNMPGTYNRDYIYPNENQMKYYATKGIRLIQIPFRWERLQHKMFGELNTADVNLLDNAIEAAAKYNIEIILDMHNYGRYRINNTDYIIGMPEVPRAAYRDAWKKLANYFKKHDNIYAYVIMAEPNNMGIYTWFPTAQAAIYGIREADRNTTIIVDGDGYANAKNWVKYSDDLKHLIDPANNLVYSAHNYFDDDCSGTYNEVNGKREVNPNIGVEKAKPFVNWLKANNKRGFFGEFGVPCTDGKWMEAMENFIRYIREENVGAMYWAGGAWWHDYPLAIEPRNGKDRPQMLVLQKYTKDRNYHLMYAKN
ncbi:MAG: glycoside hydrolase family 5 protein [Sediminibacterium sp.]|nr:glycoside hydrolase family 5 protein [Sediminibacterium sp.]